MTAAITEETTITAKPPLLLFTGGGSAGHVTPNLALIAHLRQTTEPMPFEISYMGSYHGMEKDLVKSQDIPYQAIATGKLRRYFSWRNILDPFKVLLGILQATWHCFRLKPKVVFSKGGFVALPVVIGAWLNRIPVIIHESDITPGLANRLSFPFATHICVTFAQAKNKLPAAHNVLVTGTPIRAEVSTGDAQKGLEFCGFDHRKPLLFVFGGGQGSDLINQAVRKDLTTLLQHFYVAHVCGKGKMATEFDQIDGYRQFEYLTNPYFDVLAAAQLVVSRAGANSLYELLTAHKLHLLIPLSAAASRGDQLANANYFETQGYSKILAEEQMQLEGLIPSVLSLWDNRAGFLAKLQEFPILDSTTLLCDLLTKLAGSR